MVNAFRHLSGHATKRTREQLSTSKFKFMLCNRSLKLYSATDTLQAVEQTSPPPEYESVLQDTAGFFTPAAPVASPSQPYHAPEQGAVHNDDPGSIHVQVSACSAERRRDGSAVEITKFESWNLECMPNGVAVKEIGGNLCALSREFLTSNA
eukprot:1156347-Pelagomonas_calceolata.AAC.11